MTELPVQAYEYFADRDPLTRAVMDRMVAGVSTRKFAAVGEPVGGDVETSSRSTSKTTTSELFIERTRSALSELMGRRLEDVRLWRPGTVRAILSVMSERPWTKQPKG